MDTIEDIDALLAAAERMAAFDASAGRPPDPFVLAAFEDGGTASLPAAAIFSPRLEDALRELALELLVRDARGYALVFAAPVNDATTLVVAQAAWRGPEGVAETVRCWRLAGGGLLDEGLAAPRYLPAPIIPRTRAERDALMAMAREEWDGRLGMAGALDAWTAGRAQGRADERRRSLC